MPATVVRREIELAGLAIPFVEVSGSADGPTLTVIGGVHGCEYAAMAGVRRWLAEFAGRELRGRVRAVPVLNVTAFAARAPFVVPEDGVIIFLTSSPAVAADGLLLGLGAHPPAGAPGTSPEPPSPAVRR